MLRPSATFSHQSKHSMILNLQTLCRPLTLMAALGAFSLTSVQSSSSIHIEGQLDDAAWKKARPIEAFKTFDAKTPKPLPPT
jgi:hypothetical protein